MGSHTLYVPFVDLTFSTVALGLRSLLYFMRTELHYLLVTSNKKKVSNSALNLTRGKMGESSLRVHLPGSFTIDFKELMSKLVMGKHHTK